VAGIYGAIVGQGEQFSVDVINKLLMIAARQIGTTDTAPEQHIAAYQNIVLTVIKAQMCGRMAGRVDQLQHRIAKGNRTLLGQIHLGLWRQLIPETHTWRINGHFIQHRLFTLVKLWLKAILVEHEAVAQHMVYMAMRVEQQHRLKLMQTNKIHHRVLLRSGIHAWVYNGTVKAIIIQQVSIFLVRVVFETFEHAAKVGIYCGGGARAGAPLRAACYTCATLATCATTRGLLLGQQNCDKFVVWQMCIIRKREVYLYSIVVIYNIKYI
jgi:hypothetical protein